MADNLTAANLVLRTDTTAQPSGPYPTGNAGANKLWLPLWSGEVINAYDQFNMFENMINTKTINGGFAYEFPVTGTVALNSSWDAGEELMGGDSSSTTFKVALDKRPMAAHFETDNIDLLVTQWDYRSELARQAGLQLASTRDKQIAVALAAAAAIAPLSDDPRGLDAAAFQAPGQISTSIVASSCTETEALKVLQEIENYLVVCQENDIAVTDVYCAVTPKVFQVIRALGIPRSASTVFGTNTAAINNFSNSPLFGASDNYGGNGAPISMGMNMMTDALDYMGVKIVKTNHLPKTNLSIVANNIGSSKYNLNCAANSNAAGASGANQGYETLFSFYGIIFQTTAIAGLSLQGMKVDTVQDVRRNTQFTVASMMKGTGIIRPETVRALISGSGSTNSREKLRDHFAGASVKSANNTDAGATVNTNFANGFGAEYVVTS
jgi:hypothetical protein